MGGSWTLRKDLFGTEGIFFGRGHHNFFNQTSLLFLNILPKKGDIATSTSLKKLRSWQILIYDTRLYCVSEYSRSSEIFHTSDGSNRTRITTPISKGITDQCILYPYMFPTSELYIVVRSVRVSALVIRIPVDCRCNMWRSGKNISSSTFCYRSGCCGCYSGHRVTVR